MARHYLTLIVLTLIVTVGLLLGMEETAPAAPSGQGSASYIESHDRGPRFGVRLAQKPVKKRAYRPKKELPKCVTAEEIARRNLIESGVMPRVLQSCR